VWADCNGVLLSWVGMGEGGCDCVCHDNSDSKHHTMMKYEDMEVKVPQIFNLYCQNGLF
jgi:hypothetical protein